jgi:TM2 domain-containing membrane protein YozV
MAVVDDYPLDQAHWVTRKLWWCAGADEYFLMKSPKQDRVKYAGIGGVVLCTGFLAMVSGGFAFYTAFGPKAYAMDKAEGASWWFLLLTIAFAFIWGLIIFNLDRFIVSSTGKGDGTDKMTGKEILNALPRILIALVLGFAISAPLEIRILKSEIDNELDKFQKAYTAEMNDASAKLFEQSKTELENNKKEVESKIATYEAELKTYDLQIDALKAKKDAEMQDRRAYGEGPVALAMQKNIDAKELEKNKFIDGRAADVALYKQELIDANEGLKELQQKLAVDRKNNEASSHNYSGLLKRIQISHEIGGLIPWVIFAVLLSIEMGPIFFKMMMNKGPYEYMVENFNYRMQVKNGIVKEERIYEGEKGMMLMEKINYLEVENDHKEKTAKLKAQEELSNKVVGIWSSAKMKEIESDPLKFYNESDDKNTQA